LETEISLIDNEETDDITDATTVAVVPENLSSQRIDAALVQMFEEIPSRSFAAKLIENQLVKVNGKIVKVSMRLAGLETVELNLSCFRIPESAPHAENIPLDIIFEDVHILVINKPAGLVVHPGAGNPSGTLVNAVLGHCGNTLPSLGNETRAGIVHRLDRDTSGVMVVAKTQLALTRIATQFASHQQDRRYLAIVQNVPNPQESMIETWHGRDQANRIRFAVVAEGQGKIARMRYRVLESFVGGKAALVRCELLTGRTHQIRVQMKHLRCPLIGDSLYGGDGGALRGQKTLWQELQKLATRQMLHAEHLGFEHPATGEHLCFSVPPPADFSAILALLRR
jgi:23S rRNA pseudouridine1911/1915/1917 synthase